MIEKKCDVTGKTMAPQDLDFAEANNVFHIKEKDGTLGKLSLHVRVAHNGQFREDVHVSREGMEQLMMEAAENLPSKAAIAKVPGVQGGPKPETPANAPKTTQEEPAKVAEAAEKVGKTLTR